MTLVLGLILVDLTYPLPALPRLYFGALPVK